MLPKVVKFFHRQKWIPAFFRVSEMRILGQSWELANLHGVRSGMKGLFSVGHSPCGSGGEKALRCKKLG
jgi:hypothetical protein